MAPDLKKIRIGIRIFIVNDDNTLKRLPMSRYERLLRRDPDEKLPEYAGKRIRYALSVVQLLNRKPVEILYTQYSLLYFDSEGRIDAAEQEKEWSLGAELLMPFETEWNFQHVIDARHQFTKRRYENRYNWEPSPEIESAIMEAIFDTHSR